MSAVVMSAVVMAGRAMMHSAPHVMGGTVRGGSRPARVMMVMVMMMMMDMRGSACSADSVAAEAIAIRAVEAMVAMVMMTAVMAAESVLSGNLRDGICTRNGIHNRRAVGAVRLSGRGRFASLARDGGRLSTAGLHARPQDCNRHGLAQQ